MRKWKHRIGNLPKRHWWSQDLNQATWFQGIPMDTYTTHLPFICIYV